MPYLERVIPAWQSIFVCAIGMLGALCEIGGCASGNSAIDLRTLEPNDGIVLMRQHDSPERLVWVNSALLHLDGQLRLVDEKGRLVPGVLIPGDFKAIRIDPAGRVFVGTGHGPAQVCGRVAVVPRSIFDRAVHENPNPFDAMEAIWRNEPENVGVLHVGTPGK